MNHFGNVQPAIENLTNNQMQADMDGCMVTVSRQALDEVLTAIKALTASPGEQKPVVEGYVLVPVEPTPKIIRAMHNKIDWCRDDQNTYEVEHPSQNPNGVGTTCKQDICDAYRAMIDAIRREAPAPEGVAKIGPQFDISQSEPEMIWDSDDRPDAGGGVREAFVSVLASLAAAISLLERMPKAKKAAPSDTMFAIMLDDYRKALETGRAALSTPPAAVESNASVEARLREAVLVSIDMIENCAGVPTNPDSLPQMVKVYLQQTISAVGDEAKKSDEAAGTRPVPSVSGNSDREQQRDTTGVTAGETATNQKSEGSPVQPDQGVASQHEYPDESRSGRNSSRNQSAPSDPTAERRAFVRQLVDDPNSASGKSLQDVEVRRSFPTADRREIVARIKADPGDGTLHPDLAHVLARGFDTMGWDRPASAAEDMIDAILAALDGGAGA